MIPLHQARALSLDSVEFATPVAVPLPAAHGQFLAEVVRATRSLPNFDNSAMDGFALRSADTIGANRDRPARLEIVETVYAGSSPQRSISSRQAARIFTGAPVPDGADCVVRQEAARAERDQVLVFVEAAASSNIRRKGEELAEGTLVFTPGQRLDAFALGVLASLGLEKALVWPKPKVAIVTLGDELASPGRPAEAHQVYDCNGVLLAALCAEAGAEVVAHEHAQDREEAVQAVVERRISGVDLLITAGGASVGDKDLVKRALGRAGAIAIFDGVALKPGKPAGIAILGGHPIAMLPGNPGATSVAFDQFARPMLLKRQGVTETRRRVPVRLGSAQHKQAGLTYLLSARLEEGEGGMMWAKIRPQGSGQILHSVGADGWVVLPPGRADFAAGEEATMELFHAARFDVADLRVAQTPLRDARSAIA